MTRNVFCNVFFAVGFFSGVVMPAMADNGERAMLALLMNEIKQLQPIINEAESKQIKERTQFNYAALRADIARIQAGIEQRIDRDQRVPGELVPIIGQYE
jgi:RAQPRD family integrative conjugative element protein